MFRTIKYTSFKLYWKTLTFDGITRSYWMNGIPSLRVSKTIGLKLAFRSRLALHLNEEGVSIVDLKSK